MGSMGPLSKIKPEHSILFYLCDGIFVHFLPFYIIFTFHDKSTKCDFTLKINFPFQEATKNLLRNIRSCVFKGNKLNMARVTILTFILCTPKNRERFLLGKKQFCKITFPYAFCCCLVDFFSWFSPMSFQLSWHVAMCICISEHAQLQDKSFRIEE